MPAIGNYSRAVLPRHRATVIQFSSLWFAWLFVAFACLVGKAEGHQQSERPSIAPQTKQDKPSAAAMRQSLDRVKDVFRDEFASATSPTRKRELARHLCEQAHQCENSADRWTLLTEALRLATEAVDVDAAMDIMHAAEANFVIADLATWQLETLTRLAPKATGENSEKIAAACLDAAKSALAADHDDIAVKAIGLAVGIARKTRDEELLSRATRLQQSIKERQRLEKDLAPLLMQVADNPSDAETNTLAGVTLCLRANRWKEGLPMLARSNDELLAFIAREEMSEPTTSQQRLALGDQWWDWANHQKAPLELLAQSRAVHHYALAIRELQGLDRVRLEKRIDAVHRKTGGTGETVFLADLAENQVVGQESFVKGATTARGTTFTVGGKSFPKALSAIPKASSTAVIQYTLPSGARRCRGKAGIYRPSHAKPGEQPLEPIIFEIVIDGESVWQSPPLIKLDDTTAFDVELGTARTLELRMRCAGSNWCAWGAWLDPVILK
jgi:hypothetical protein